MAEILFISIFRLSGAYVGVLTSDGWFFDAEGRYIGWHDKNSQVWHRDGTYLGEIIDENFILRRQGWLQSVRKTPKVPPIAPELPAAPPNRLPIAARPGWVDALDNILRKPESSELHGQWIFQEGAVTFSANQQYTLLVSGQSAETGVWQLRGNLILTPEQRSQEQPANVVYQILEFSSDKMVIRRLVHEGRSLPFSMTREIE